jgi:nucleotide-binding universal stress UspA family protein
MFQKILAAVDGSATSNNALDYAVRLARRSDAQLRLVYCMEKPPKSGEGRPSPSFDEESRIPATVLEDAWIVAAAAGVKADKKLIQPANGDLGHLIAEEARRWDADVIVLGADGKRAPGPSALGTGAAKVIGSASVPVLVIPIRYPFNADR